MNLGTGRTKVTAPGTYLSGSSSSWSWDDSCFSPKSVELRAEGRCEAPQQLTGEVAAAAAARAPAGEAAVSRTATQPRRERERPQGEPASRCAALGSPRHGYQSPSARPGGIF